jgi:hypothetical protein
MAVSFSLLVEKLDTFSSLLGYIVVLNPTECSNSVNTGARRPSKAILALGTIILRPASNHVPPFAFAVGFNDGRLTRD